MIDTQKITDDPHGRFWRYGRFYVRHYPGDGEQGGKTHEVGWQWSLLRKGTIGFGLSTSDCGGDSFEASVSLGRIGAFYFSADGFWLGKQWGRLAGKEFPRDRHLSISCHGGLICWNLWTAGMGYNPKARWRERCWNWQRFLGWHPEHVSWETLEVIRTVVPMPEGTYDATVELKRGTWRRRRLFAWMPKVHHFTGGITPDKPIPVPGKGENSWDCDDDAIHSSSGPYSTVHQAVAALVDSVYRQRTRYGSGPEWRPTTDVGR
jgi:hypothetical protein